MLFPINPEDFSNNKTYCSAWVATAIVGSAVVGGMAKAYAANSAAEAQRSGADASSRTAIQAGVNANNALGSFNEIAQSYLSPYRDIGGAAGNELTTRLRDLTTPIGIPQEMQDLRSPLSTPQEMLDLRKPLNISQEELEKLPGYQFALQQGLKSTQNSAAARGLGVSGAALKGAATFSKGLADSTFENYFQQQQQNVNNAFGRYSTTLGQQEGLRQDAFGRYDTTLGRQVTQQGNAFDRLKGLVDTGLNASAFGANVAQKTGSDVAKTTTAAGGTVASNQIGAANADAAAINATGQAVGDVANSVGGYAAYKGLYGAPSAPNLAYTKGIAGDRYVPTYG